MGDWYVFILVIDCSIPSDWPDCTFSSFYLIHVIVNWIFILFFISRYEAQVISDCAETC